MRLSARKDANQTAIAETFRALGCSVEFLHRVGQGVPDLLVGICGANYLVEVKDGSKSPSRRRLTDDEAEWHERWKGQVCTVETLDDVTRVVKAIRSGGFVA